ncbi:MAG: hypothetical protein L0213_13635, partial [Candidatus Dadabacteria bacterium]|nr:hypothetical protein [Candidatus Dadabacteria bacterium]
DLFIQRIVHYREKYGCRHLFLLDESVPPKRASLFSSALIERGLDVRWSLRTRIDRGFTREVLLRMHEAGCRELWVGLETVNPRLLEMMNKTKEPGDYAEAAAALMRDCDEIGIGLHFCLMFGFPSETAAEREELIAFFEKNISSIKNVPFFTTFNTFGLMPGSRMLREPENYGIIEVIRDKDHFDMISIPYKTAFHDDTGSASVREEIENTARRLTDLFVKNRFLEPLWFFAADSSYEMLLKERFSSGNPFQAKMNAAVLPLVKLFLLFERTPYLSRAWRALLRKWGAGVG